MRPIWYPLDGIATNIKNKMLPIYVSIHKKINMNIMIFLKETIIIVYQVLSDLISLQSINLALVFASNGSLPGI